MFKNLMYSWFSISVLKSVLLHFKSMSKRSKMSQVLAPTNSASFGKSCGFPWRRSTLNHSFIGKKYWERSASSSALAISTFSQSDVCLWHNARTTSPSIKQKIWRKILFSTLCDFSLSTFWYFFRFYQNPISFLGASVVNAVCKKYLIINIAILFIFLSWTTQITAF